MSGIRSHRWASLAGVALAFACGDSGGSSDDTASETGSTSTSTADTGGQDASASAETSATDGGTTAGADDTGGIDPLENEIGFVEIEPISYTLHAGSQSQPLTASRARLWYGFQPADEAPQDKPIVIMFNGGPGAASEILFSFNPSQRSFDEGHNGGAQVGPSPASWTSFANVLYVDARTTGFSYNMMDDPSNDAARMAEFDSDNFNVFIDAADFVRVLLRFLADHPSIQGNDVVVVGESYGGVRATAMLDLLLDYAAHAGGSVAYEDDALVAEIQAHLDAVFPAMAGQTFGPADVAKQFGHQVLVQPLVLGARQLQVTGQMHDAPGSVIFDIATDVGQTFTPCSQQGGGCEPNSNAFYFVEMIAGRDRFAYPRPYNWLFDRIDSLAPKYSTLALATEMFGADPTAVPELFADARAQAYRTPGNAPLVPGGHRDTLRWDPAVLIPGPPIRLSAPTPPVHLDGDFPATFGDLAPYDTYYLASNYLVLDMFYGSLPTAYGIDPYSDVLANAFARNVAYVDTFITNAAWDLVIWGPSIPEAMKQLTTHIAAVTHDTAAGQVVVSYRDGAFGLGAGETRTIRMPYYEASHTVPLDTPSEIRDDLMSWIQG